MTRTHDISPETHRCIQCNLHVITIALHPEATCPGSKRIEKQQYEVDAEEVKRDGEVLKRRIDDMGRLYEKAYLELNQLRTENERLKHYIAKLTRPWWARWLERTKSK